MRYPIKIDGFDQLVSKIDILIDQNNKTFSQDALVAFLGGFSGAFFAFLLSGLAAYISKRRERYVKHKNAVVKMEYILVKHQDKVGLLIFLLENTIAILKKGNFTYNRFSGLNIVEGIELDLADINLINNVSNYWLSVERVSSDCNSLNRILEVLQKVLLSGTPPHADNFKHLINQMESILKYLKGPFLDENVELNAYIRAIIAVENKNSELKKLLAFYRITEHKVTQAQIDKIKKTIYKEIEERVKEEKKRLGL